MKIFSDKNKVCLYFSGLSKFLDKNSQLRYLLYGLSFLCYFVIPKAFNILASPNDHLHEKYLQSLSNILNKNIIYSQALSKYDEITNTFKFFVFFFHIGLVKYELFQNFESKRSNILMSQKILWRAPVFSIKTVERD